MFLLQFVSAVRPASPQRKHNTNRRASLQGERLRR